MASTVLSASGGGQARTRGRVPADRYLTIVHLFNASTLFQPNKQTPIPNGSMIDTTKRYYRHDETTTNNDLPRIATAGSSSSSGRRTTERRERTQGSSSRDGQDTWHTPWVAERGEDPEPEELLELLVVFVAGNVELFLLVVPHLGFVWHGWMCAMRGNERLRFG